MKFPEFSLTGEIWKHIFEVSLVARVPGNPVYGTTWYKCSQVSRPIPDYCFHPKNCYAKIQNFTDVLDFKHLFHYVYGPQR